jgi:hypothetical protein
MDFSERFPVKHPHTFYIGTQAQHCVSVFRIVVGDALNSSGEGIHNSKYTRRGSSSRNLQQPQQIVFCQQI